MNYTTKDGAHFTSWWHPFAYAVLWLLFWPLVLIGPTRNTGAAILVTIVTHVVTLLMLAGAIGIVSLFLR